MPGLARRQTGARQRGSGPSLTRWTMDAGLGEGRGLGVGTRTGVTAVIAAP